MTVGGVTFPLEQQSKDPQSVVYTGQYDTEGVAHTKSGERQPVQINIQVRILNILYTGQEAHWGSQHRMKTLFVDVGKLSAWTLFFFCSVLIWLGIGSSFDLNLFLVKVLFLTLAFLSVAATLAQRYVSLVAPVGGRWPLFVFQFCLHSHNQTKKD